MREGDYSIRARSGAGGDAMSEVMQQVNAMAATLRAQRLGALEATALLRKVMEEIEVAIFAFDGQQTLRLVNAAGERLLAEPAERLLGRDADSLGLAEYLAGEHQQTIQRAFSDPTRRWGSQPRHVSRRRPAPPTARHHRHHPSPAGRGTASLAAPGARPGP